MNETDLIKIAKVVYAEGAVFSGKNQSALLAIAQCVRDLLPQYATLDECLKSAFTQTTDQYDSACLQAAKDIFENGKSRFLDAKILGRTRQSRYGEVTGLIRALYLSRQRFNF